MKILGPKWLKPQRARIVKPETATKEGWWYGERSGIHVYATSTSQQTNVFIPKRILLEWADEIRHIERARKP